MPLKRVKSISKRSTRRQKLEDVLFNESTEVDTLTKTRKDAIKAQKTARKEGFKTKIVKNRGKITKLFGFKYEVLKIGRKKGFKRKKLTKRQKLGKILNPNK